MYQGKKVKNVASITLFENHRDPVVDDLIEVYEEYYEKRNKKK